VAELGGAARAIEARFFQEEIGRSAYDFQLAVERGDTTIVGVNKFADGEAPPVIPTPDYSELERGQVARLRAVKLGRDAGAVKATLQALSSAAPAYAAADGSSNRPSLMPLIIDAVRARASVGEISDVLRGVWGEYRPT
jgi:methylmalonyl-CoA mutase N-terminal domain/subunit